MALINCRECGAQMSSEARVCPHCGCPSKEQAKYQAQADKNTSSGRVLSVIFGIILFIVGMVLVFNGSVGIGYGG